MKAKILFVERKFWKKNFNAFSLEKVFEQIARLLSADRYESEIVKVPYGNSFLEIIKNLLCFKKSEADIYHITGQIHYLALILPPEKTVLTIHDLGFLDDDRKISGFLIKKLFLDLPVKRLRFITAVSETTKQAILENSDCPAEKIRVIENPVQDHYFSQQTPQFNADCPTILQIGITPNKNIPNLIKALKGIDCRLKIIGNLTEDLIVELKHSEINYENSFGLDDSQMRNEYEKADIVAFCSTFEGFGLPIIEAQAMKKPLITSDLSPMKEVSGGAAYLADPRSVDDIRKGILQIINDAEYRKKIIARGFENVQRFESKKIAEKYERLYDEILGPN